LSILLKRPLEKVSSRGEVGRLNKAYYNYDYYSGRQHEDVMGRLVRSDELERPDGHAYDPARLKTTNLTAPIKRKARWQMAGDHGIEVGPNTEDASEIESAQKHEELLYKLWEDNKMDAKKLAVARDRMIGGMVACKLAYNARDGKLH